MATTALVKRSDAHRSGIAVNDAKSTSEIDVHVGQRLRLRRTILGMRQEEVADAVGVTYQQIQKYERGETRLSIGRLFDIGLVLGVPIEWFLDGLCGDAPARCSLSDLLEDRETAELLRLYARVKNPRVRRQFLDLAKALVSAADTEAADQL